MQLVRSFCVKSSQAAGSQGFLLRETPRSRLAFTSVYVMSFVVRARASCSQDAARDASTVNPNGTSVIGDFLLVVIWTEHEHGRQ